MYNNIQYQQPNTNYQADCRNEDPFRDRLLLKTLCC